MSTFELSDQTAFSAPSATIDPNYVASSNHPSGGSHHCYVDTDTHRTPNPQLDVAGMLRKINNMRIDAQESEAARLAASGIDGRNEVIPSGPRRPGQGCEEVNQAIMLAEPTSTGGVRLRITLLAAGFIIGPIGGCIREISRLTGADIRSRTVPSDALCIRDCREFTIEGPSDASVAHAMSIVLDAVKRYKTLCEGSCAGQVVSRSQHVAGVEFFYQPPPRSVVPLAACLKGHSKRSNPQKAVLNMKRASSLAASSSSSSTSAAARQEYLMRRPSTFKDAVVGAASGSAEEGQAPYAPLKRAASSPPESYLTFASSTTSGGDVIGGGICSGDGGGAPVHHSSAATAAAGAGGDQLFNSYSHHHPLMTSKLAKANSESLAMEYAFPGVLEDPTAQSSSSISSTHATAPPPPPSHGTSNIATLAAAAAAAAGLPLVSVHAHPSLHAHPSPSSNTTTTTARTLSGNVMVPLNVMLASQALMGTAAGQGGGQSGGQSGGGGTSGASTDQLHHQNHQNHQQQQQQQSSFSASDLLSALTSQLQLEHSMEHHTPTGAGQSFFNHCNKLGGNDDDDHHHHHHATSPSSTQHHTSPADLVSAFNAFTTDPFNHQHTHSTGSIIGGGGSGGHQQSHPSLNLSSHFAAAAAQLTTTQASLSSQSSSFFSDSSAPLAAAARAASPHEVNLSLPGLFNTTTTHRQQQQQYSPMQTAAPTPASSLSTSLSRGHSLRSSSGPLFHTTSAGVSPAISAAAAAGHHEVAAAAWGGPVEGGAPPLPSSTPALTWDAQHHQYSPQHTTASTPSPSAHDVNQQQQQHVLPKSIWSLE